MKAKSRISHLFSSMGVRRKFSLVILGIVLFGGLLTTLYIETVMSKALTEELEEKGLTITRNLAADSVNLILVDDPVGLQRHLYTVKDTEEDVVYGYILDPQGQVMVHTFEGGFPKGLAGSNVLPYGQTYAVELLDTEEGYIQDIAVPIMGGEAGIVHIGVSEIHIKQKITRTRHTLFGMTLLVLMFGILLAHRLGTVMVRPLEILTEGAKEIGMGNLDQRVQVDTRDEIGILAGTFNKMAGDLKKHRDHLEELVNERTKKLKAANEQLMEEIAERKRAEEELQEREEHYRTLVETSPNAIVVTDLDGKIISENLEGMVLFGWKSEGEMVGESIFEFVVPEDRSRMGENVQKTMDSGSVKDVEYTMLKKDGTPFPAEVNTSIILGLDWKPTAVLRIIRDITKRKKAEEDIKKYTAELEEANKLKDLFTDIMRHDLLNPAGSVRSLTEVLMDLEESEDKKNLLKSIRTSSAKLIDMIESASLYAKLETIDEIERRRLNLKDILRDLVMDFGFMLKEQDMVLDLKADGNYSLKASSMIENVFSNLISNAIKYSPEGSRIEVDIQDNGDDWTVYVKNQGEGISDENKEQIFTRFRRVGKEGVKGVGLGLTIVKRIVDLHHGKVWVEDNPEGGSIFFVSLPKGGSVISSKEDDA